jgi:hypothetical protein
MPRVTVGLDLGDRRPQNAEDQTSNWYRSRGGARARSRFEFWTSMRAKMSRTVFFGDNKTIPTGVTI